MESTMRLLTTALLVLTLPACIEFDEELVFDEEEEEPNTERPNDERPVRPDSPTPSEDFTLSPDSAELCDILLVSVAHPEDLVIDEVAFFGPSDLTVINVDDRPAELLVTVRVPADGALGLNDLLLETSDGDTLVVEDAFAITADGC